MRTLGNIAFGIVVVVAFVLAVTSLVQVIHVNRPVPACEEDAVLVGSGDFEGGRWTTYVCGPAVDDYTP